ncbi:SDR family oxidoreductase [Microbacterium sp. dk485]|uniref:SDR family NAD(P)-dependent oxidoreductase n=1 Tax=Microbacterium sp. dk485 TaxID=2560021 RepID=UPI0010733E52|nr:SDR family oxidoreductase [Microbacterium sp. dk485]TFV82446.1 SDR family oxidoreductase [Microbacterium sp. dk485]
MTDERIILITGGSRGLGRAAALALADGGDDIVLTYRSDAEAAAAVVAEVHARGRRAVALPLDTTAPDTFAEFAERLRDTLGTVWARDTFDVLVNNAGYGGTAPLGGFDRDSIDRLVAVHFTGVVLLTQQLSPALADGGRILNVSSGLTRMAAPGMAVYAAVKSAVETFTVYLARELGPRRIAVNVIAPGATATDFGGGAVRDDEQYRAVLLPMIAMGRIGEPDDIGAAVAALLDRRMAWVTGQRIEASGGQRL